MGARIATEIKKPLNFVDEVMPRTMPRIMICFKLIGSFSFIKFKTNNIVNATKAAKGIFTVKRWEFVTHDKDVATNKADRKEMLRFFIILYAIKYVQIIPNTENKSIIKCPGNSNEIL